MCPSGRIPARPERARMRLPLPRVGLIFGGTLASPARYSSMKNTGTYPFLQHQTLTSSAASQGTSGFPPVTALSIEFVAKPQEAHRVQTAIPSAIAGALKDIDGFAGCLVMISDHEARLVTVVTLWAGNDRAECCSQNTRWVQALLKPYLDRCLRVQTMVAHLPVLPMQHFLPAIPPETDADDECSILHSGICTDDHIISTDETVCMA
jgi:hypothetical protein